jgi:hypothetical protein
MGECQHVEKLELHCEQKGIIEDIITYYNWIQWSEQQWQTAETNKVTYQKAKVCLRWKNWKRTENRFEENKIN